MFCLGVEILCEKKFFLFLEVEIFFDFFDQFLNLNSKVSRDFYWYFLKWIMKNPSIKSGSSVATYCSKARKYIEFAKGYRFDDQIVNQRTFILLLVCLIF